MDRDLDQLSVATIRTLVLSNGHSSMLLCSLLHLAGVKAVGSKCGWEIVSTANALLARGEG